MNQDRFRSSPRPVTAREGQAIAAIAAIKRQAEAMAALIQDEAGENGGREAALALTKLDEAVMWAVKGITS